MIVDPAQTLRLMHTVPFPVFVQPPGHCVPERVAPVALEPNQIYHIAVKQQVKYRLPAPYPSDCKDYLYEGPRDEFYGFPSKEGMSLAGFMKRRCFAIIFILGIVLCSPPQENVSTENEAEVTTVFSGREKRQLSEIIYTISSGARLLIDLVRNILLAVLGTKDILLGTPTKDEPAGNADASHVE
ncbi:uncharacterized protein LOC121047165 [Ixodes scapularis]|uniref:uncharacterized protein LOC121047165 n=1 Tax=Ixodes scapularis TaxID=6945 RepID=UPI001C387560|nr:uncharacterized protein LOC121047165 [Ixodes scapularis]